MSEGSKAARTKKRERHKSCTRCTYRTWSYIAVHTHARTHAHTHTQRAQWRWSRHRHRLSEPESGSGVRPPREDDVVRLLFSAIVEAAAAAAAAARAAAWAAVPQTMQLRRKLASPKRYIFPSCSLSLRAFFFFSEKKNLFAPIKIVLFKGGR